MTPKTNIIYLWRHRIAPNNLRKSRFIVGNIVLGNLKVWGVDNFENVGKDKDGQIPSSGPTVLIILNMGSISSRKHEMEIW